MLFDSPYLDKLTTELEMTSIEFKEFTLTEAVESFVLSCYVGDLESCTGCHDDLKSMFRQLTKLASTLEVEWLIKKCYAVFDEMLESLALDCKDYLKMVRYVDEAQLFASMDERHRCLLENTIKRIQDIRATSFFLSNYIKDLDCLSLSEIDIIIKIAGSEVDIIVRLSLDIILGLIRNDTKVPTILSRTFSRTSS